MSSLPGPVPFQLKKFADYGAGHPACARISLQMFDLLNGAQLGDALKEQIRQHLFRATDEMVKAQRKKDAFLEKCQRFMDDVKAGRGVVVRQQALELREPEGIADDYELFLLHLTIALRMALKAAGLILVGKPAGWSTVKKTLEERFANGHPLHELVRQHEAWTDGLFAARGEIEHDPFLFTGFKVELGTAGVLRVVDPKMPDGSSAVETVARYYDDGLVFMEDLVARVIESTYPAAFVLQEIPAEQRDATKPVRYSIAMRPDALPAEG